MDYESSDFRVTDLDSQVTDLKDTVRKLERQQHKFDDLGNSIDELRSELESLQSASEDNESAAREQVGDLKERLEELESDVGDATHALSRLGDRMGWVERHIRASGEATKVNFDDQAAELAPLVQTVKQGQQARAQLLDDAARRQLERSAARFEEQTRRINELTAQALQASATLMTTSYSEQEHTNAAKAFSAAFTTRQSETKLHQQQQTSHEQERTRLAEDDRLRDTHAVAIRAGEDAARNMRIRLRTTIAQAIGESALPPMWFTNPLGFTPPPSDADEWLDTATEILTYRITYRVTDPVLTLGATPDINNSGRYRWQWHNQLVGKLRRYTS